MKKMKCESCGGVLTPDENNEYAHCEYCGSKYKMKEDINININTNGNFKNIKVMIPVIIVFIIIFSCVAFTIIRSNPFGKSDEITSEFDVKSFNSKFELYNGTQSKFFVEKLLEDIVTSNKTNDNKILVSYDNKETEEPTEITEIKHSLSSGDYEVSFDYDAKAYIYKVNIEIIEK